MEYCDSVSILAIVSLLLNVVNIAITYYIYVNKSKYIHTQHLIRPIVRYPILVKYDGGQGL